MISSIDASAGVDADNRDLFQAAFALSLAAVAVIDDDRRFLAVSDAACTTLGRDRDALIGHRIDDCIPPASRARMRAAWPSCLGVESRAHELVILQPDGSERPVTMMARANVLTGRHLLTLEPESEHRRAEDEIEQLFAVSPDLLAVAGDNGYLVRANPACERALGYSHDELLARPFIDFICAEDQPAAVAALARLGDGASGYTLTHRMRCRDGSYSSVEWNVVRVPGERMATAVGRVVRQRPDGEPSASRPAKTAGRTPGAGRAPADVQEWVGEQSYRGIEPSLVWAIERQLDILDEVTRLSPHPRVAAVRCALALRQALVEMGTIVTDLRPASIIAFPVGGEADPHAPHHRAARGAADIELTERERDVLRLVAQGHDNRMICGELFLAEVTVKKHIQRSMAKLGVTSRTQLLLAAMSLGLGR